jgi:hypothetical protein
MQQMDLSCIENNIVLQFSICHLVKVNLKTFESNCNWKNYLANSRFVPPIDFEKVMILI